MNNMNFIEKCEKKLEDKFKSVDKIAYFNQVKILNAFSDLRVAQRHFNGTTGYGYDDDGRDCLGKLYAKIFGAEEGIVSPHIVSGTHALTVALFGLLRPNDTLLCVSGIPYDTIRGVIYGENNGSLKDFGVNFECCDLIDGKFDIDSISKKIDDSVKVVYIQRSRGYELRDAFSCAEIKEVCSFIRKCGFTGCIFVDNCYGEFVETREPSDLGADMVVGSLIKNPGGGLAPTGGYIAGRRDLVEGAAMRLTVPGIGGECGCTLGQNRLLYQGLFLAPHTVSQAVKTAVFAAKVMELLGYETEPHSSAVRHDIIQMIHMREPEALKKFCKGIQFGAPVDSYVTPEPWDMPGYDCQVIMAAGAFIQGASIELSADAPMREPYTVYLQGGLTYESGRTGVMLAAEELLKS